MNENTNTNTAVNVNNLLNKAEDRWIFRNNEGEYEFAFMPSPGDDIKVATHSGQFHADEILAIWLLETFWLQDQASQVIRTRDPEILEGCIRLDVGEGLLDHHGPRAERGVAACTRVWELMKRSGYVSQAAQEALDGIVRIVAAWDTGDNTEPHPMPYIHAMSAAATALGQESQEGWFQQALDAARRHLAAVLIAAEVAAAAKSLAELEIAEAGDSSVVTFSAVVRAANVKELLWQKKHPAIFYVSPEGDEDWRILCCADPATEEFSPFNSRKLLAEKFRGLRGEELSAACGIEGGIFCHAAGFIAGFKTREAAEAFARLNLN